MKTGFEAYAAGFFDGEGSVYARVRDGNRIPDVLCMITSTDEEPIRTFCEHWGGSIANRKKLPKPHHKPQFQWTMAARNAERFLTDLMPWLIIKKPQAELALKFWRLQQLPRRERISYETDRSVRPEHRRKCIELTDQIRGLNKEHAPSNARRKEQS